ncbi:methyltransferase family protein [Luteimonas sp. SDU101]|uniref:methyltransferase family protein n=1 Tax=Luteimonas sp. SDU101 TaxID=3422593 RepID=UPI003EB97D21
MASDVAPAGATPTTAPWLVRSTSPLHCVLAFAAGALVQGGLDLPVPHGSLRDGLQLAGTVLANGGLLLVLWSFALFARRRTTIMPGNVPSGLVRGGPFRRTRNPVYIGMLASYVGLALMYDLPWALAMLPLPVWVLQHRIIPWEEATLQSRLGAAYAAYRDAVPRWL